MKSKLKKQPGAPDAAAQAGEPPAQAGDQVETKVASAQPKVKLPTEAEASKELADNPERHSVLSQSGHIVRER